MSNGEAGSFEGIEAYLEHVVESTSRFDSWEKHGDDYWLEGDNAAFGEGFVAQILAFGYVPKSCSADQLIITPLELSIETWN